MKMSDTLQGCLFCQRMGSIFKPEVKKTSELGSLDGPFCGRGGGEIGGWGVGVSIFSRF